MAFIARKQLKCFLNVCVARQKKFNIHQIIREFHRTSIALGNIIPFNLSDIGEGITEVAVKEWFVKEGDKVSQFDNICEVQSDKASVTITSRYDGLIKKIHYEVDQTAYVGKPLIDIEVEGESETTQQEKTEENSGSNKEHEQELEKPNISNLDSQDYSLCIPSVRRLAKQYKLDLTNIKGTGKKSRILKEDVLRYLQKTQKDDSINSPRSIETTDEIVKLKGFQKAMFQTMTASLTIPHFNYNEEIKMTKLSKLRKELNKSDIGVKLSYMPFFIKAISLALSEYTMLNSSLDLDNETVIIKKSHNIGVAMDTKVGLAVPVIHNVESKKIYDIAKELNQLMEKGKEGNFSLDDLKGGTFTFSNIGVIGGLYVSPVILSPQVGIAAIGAIRTVPKFDENSNVYPEQVLYITGAGDHRIIDGATMASFINLVKKYIENPYLLLLKS